MTNIQEDDDSQELDLTSEEITSALAEAPIFLKKAIVQARPAEAGEQIKTILTDGTVETKNTAQAGDIIVTNPGGEQYILKFEKFSTRYEAIDEAGNFRAKGMIRAIENPTGNAINVMAPWGEQQHGDAKCIIATAYDPTQPEIISDDRYIIGKDEFATTYEQVKNTRTDTTAVPLTPDQLASELVEALPEVN